MTSGTHLLSLALAIAPYTDMALMRSCLSGLTGVYALYNSVNGKCYVGSSVPDVYSRVLDYGQPGYQATHSTDPIVRALVKYGKEAFIVLLLADMPGADTLEVRAVEQAFITAYSPEYNQLKVVGSSLGFNHTPETKLLLSAAMLGKPRSPESIAAQSATIMGAGNHFYDKAHTPEALAAITAAAFARKGSNAPATAVMILDTNTGVSITCRSVRMGAKYSTFTKPAITRALKQGTPLATGVYAYHAFTSPCELDLVLKLTSRV